MADYESLRKMKEDDPIDKGVAIVYSEFLRRYKLEEGACLITDLNQKGVGLVRLYSIPILKNSHKKRRLINFVQAYFLEADLSN